MTETFEDIRASVRALCAAYPGEYWQRLDATRSYPEAFVDSLSQAGYLAALIPEQYGGSGLGLPAAAAILEEIQRSGCTAAPAMRRCTRWERCCGTGLRSRRPTSSSASSAKRASTSAPISTNLILADLAEHVLELPRSY